MALNFKRIQLLILFSLFFSCKNANIQLKEPDKNQVITPKIDTYRYLMNMNFTTVSNIKFINDLGATNYFYSIYVENFDGENGNTWDDLEHYAKSKDYTNKGLTVVFFFNSKKYTPKLDRTLDIAEIYDKHCVAGYWHYPTGIEEFKIYPFK